MAVKGIDMGLAAVLVSLLWAGVAAQSGCTSVLITMAPCLNYVTGSSSTPSSSCCSQLANVVKSRPECLCTALNGGGSSLGVTINQTLALALPGACKVETPPVSRCNASNGSPVSPAASPAASPEGAPADTSNGTPSSSTSSSGSKTVPASGESTSSGAVVKMPLQLTFLLIFIAAYGSTIATTSEFSSGFLAA